MKDRFPEICICQRSSCNEAISVIICLSRRGMFMISKFVLFAAVIAFFSGGLPVATAQEPGSAGIPVHTVVTVETRHGQSAPVVNREDLMVYEGRERDKVTDWMPAQGEH